MAKKRKAKRSIKKHQKDFFHNKKSLVLIFFLFMLVAISVRDREEQLILNNDLLDALRESDLGEEDLDAEAMVMLEVNGDFENLEQGTFLIKVKLDMNKLATNFGKIPKYVVFFKSQKIPRLTLRYNLHDSVIEGGLPLIKTGPLHFMDNEFHEVTYTFHEQQGQAIYFDKQKMLQTPYDPTVDLITGNVALDSASYVLGEVDLGWSNHVSVYIGDKDTLP